MIGIVFVHGIVGNNRIFDFICPHLPEGSVVKYVVLDGHGGNALDFSRTSMSVWRRQVEDTVKDMGGMCEKVVGIGHSMGCLLLLDEEVRRRLSGLFLLNPPLKIRLRTGLLKNAFKVALGYTEKDAVARAAEEAYGISVDLNLMHYYGWPSRYLELFAEIRRIRRSLLVRMPCPVSVVLAEKDEMVSVTSMEIFEGKENINVLLLPESHHYYYSPDDKAAICLSFTELMKCLECKP